MSDKTNLYIVDIVGWILLALIVLDCVGVALGYIAVGPFIFSIITLFIVLPICGNYEDHLRNKLK